MKKLYFIVLLFCVAFFTVYPLFRVLVVPFAVPGAAAGLMQHFADPHLQMTLRNTLLMSAGAMLLSLVIGIPLAWRLARSNLPGRCTWRTLFLMPYLIPPYIGAIAWIDLANPNVGLLNRLLGATVLNIYSLPGMIWVLGLFFYTFVLLAVSAALENIDPSLEESARMCGASPWRVARDISLPLVRPAVLSSGFLVFLAAAAAFGVPCLIGGGRKIPVLTGSIYEKVRTGGLHGIFDAGVIALPLLLLALFALTAIGRLGRAQGFAVISGKGTAAGGIDLGRVRWVWLGVCLVLFGLIVVLPISSIVFSAFLEIPGRFDRISFSHFKEVFAGQPGVTRAILNSLLLSAGAASLAVLAGEAAGFLRARNRSLIIRPTELCLSIPYATPGVIITLGLILAFSRGIRLTDTLWILLIACFVKYTSFAVRTVYPNTQQIDPALARGPIMGSSLLLLDEPLSNLDARLRLQMRDQIKELSARAGVTMNCVMHNQEEAMVLSDRVVVMNEGRVLQIGTPEAVRRNPADTFVRGFIR